MLRKLGIFLVVILIVSFSFYGFLYSNYSVPILMYHSFEETLEDKYVPISLATFYEQMAFIKKRGYKVISLDQYCRLLKYNSKLAHNLIVLTADDGYKDNMEAIKVLNDFELPATIFLIVDRIDRDGYLSKDDIRWFLKNTKVDIGSHTLSHIYLPTADGNVLKDQIYKSKKVLESTFDVKVSAITYPIGGFDERVLREVEESGYLCGCTTNRGFSRKLNLFSLRRIKITEKDRGLRLLVKLSGFYNVFRRVKQPH